MEAIDYGERIDKEQGNKHFKAYLDVKRRVLGTLRRAFATDKEAARFFCGKPLPANGNSNGNTTVQKPVIDDSVYIFDKDAIMHTLQLLIDDKADGIAIFNGVRNQEIDKSQADEDNGRPTLVIFPYKYENLEGKRSESFLKIMLDDGGSEHPGTGGSGIGGDGKAIENDEIPPYYVVSDIYKTV